MPNTEILNDWRQTALKLSAGQFPNYNLRYFTAINAKPGGYRWFIGRGCKFCTGLRNSDEDDFEPSMDWFTTFAIKPAWGRTTPANDRTRSPFGDEMQEIVHDYSISHNLDVVYDNGRLIGLGGQKGGKFWGVDHHGPGYESSRELRDGMRILLADSWAAVLGGAWTHPKHDASTWFAGEGFTSEEDERCCFDSVVSIVKHRGHWLVYSRVNMKYWGGRFVQVSRSLNADVRGEYLKSQPIDIAGYNPRGPGNVYFGVVHKHPLDDSMLIGMFPINMGEQGEPNGDGYSFIGMALSCDGFKWSELVYLFRSRGRDGRTYDQPVKGLFLIGTQVHFYIHRDVEHIAPGFERYSHIEEFSFKTSKLEAFTRTVKQSNMCR